MTSDQWIALAAVIFGGVVGALGVLAAIHGGSRDREAARSLARDQRQQERLEARYQEMVILLARRRAQVNAIRPFLPYKGQAAPPGFDENEVERVSAVAIAHASKEVWLLLAEFNAVIARI